MKKQEIIKPIFVMRILVACIAVALFILLNFFVALILLGPNSDWSVLANDQKIVKWMMALLVCLGVFATITVIYVLLGVFSAHKKISKYDKFYNVAAPILLALMFIFIGSVFVSAINTLTGILWPTFAMMIFSGLFSFSLILSSWYVEEEERLKNFMDVVARTCTALTFIGGICAVFIKFLFQ